MGKVSQLGTRSCFPSIQAAQWPDWAAAAAGEVDAEPAEGEAALVLFDGFDLRLTRDGTRKGTRRRVVRVLTSEGAAAATVVLTNSSLQEHRNVRVWVRDPSGRVERYADESLFAIARQEFFDDTYLSVIAPTVMM